jgi:hypothetical protein
LDECRVPGVTVSPNDEIKGRVSLGGDIVHDCTLIDVSEGGARTMKQRSVPWPPVVHLYLEGQGLITGLVVSDDGSIVLVKYEG